MFEPQEAPRVFVTPPGVDLPRALLDGLAQRLGGQGPEAWARLELFVPTRRMRRRILALLGEGSARLLPRIRTIADLGRESAVAGLGAPVSPLRRRLELTRLISALLERAPDLAPRAALFDLADSLAGLMDEMQGEGVEPTRLQKLDVAGHSAHWARSLQFLEIVGRYFGETRHEAPDAEARQRLVVEHLARRWQEAPPDHPVIVAGSTGSRGTTGLLMQAVARLPQGALVLPGFDTDLPAHVWERLGEPAEGEDHPQFRFARLLDALGLAPADLPHWAPDHAPHNPARNRLVSLALRPAPVTDQWLGEGARIDRETLADATADLTLIEAPSPRAEAVAIALRLRAAAEAGQRAALITPDRVLTRQVTAALGRWEIEPDDSAGQPLALSAPGRFLRHVAELFGRKLTATALLTLLKHPLTASGSARGNHLRFSRDLELECLRRGLPFPSGADLTGWARERHAGDAARLEWADWLARLLDGLEAVERDPLERHVARHLRLAEALAAGPEGAAGASGGLWEKPAGRKARELCEELAREAGAAGVLSAADYRDLFHAVLGRSEVHDPESPHPGVMVWGTMEARVQGADLVILGGLNDGTWPEIPAPDPWLSRRMRLEAGLLLPERRIGLAAHDFQQAVAAREVVLSRAIRDEEAETVASRWLLRLKNLLTGLPRGGPEALAAMQARGDAWLRLAGRLDERAEGPLATAPRPAPRPPVAVRPRQLSVTRIGLLVRDPYAIYAQYILKLRPLDALQQSPDALLRGTVLHQVAERFIEAGTDPAAPEAAERLMCIAEETLAREVPWPAARRLWLARLGRVAAQFLRDEAARRQAGENLANEVEGRLHLAETGFTLTAKADRIDRLAGGGLAIYDYKSGKPPAKKARSLYDKQLELEALIARAGGFDGIAAAPVARIAHIPLGTPDPFRPEAPEPEALERIGRELAALIAAWQEPAQGYTAIRLPPDLGFASDYRHLARFGEWDVTQPPEPEEVGHGS